MTSTTIRATRVGGSIMIRIPKEIADIEHITEGTYVHIDVKKARRDFFGSMKGVKPFTKEDRMRSKYD